MSKRHAIISLSGGMDSSTLLLRCLEKYNTVTAISFNYGQKHSVELERAKDLVEYLNTRSSFIKAGHFVDREIQLWPEIKHTVIELQGLSELLNSNLVTGGKEVPEGHYEDANQKLTVVPNRNKIFSSIVQAVALSKVKSTEDTAEVLLGIHAGDFGVYPDCRQEFRDADEEAFKLGNWESEKVTFQTPYLTVMKGDILKDGVRICEKLGIDFDEVYKRTNTSYKPIYLDGKWYADCRSASSIERIEGFIELGRPDPADYADNGKVVDWEYVKAHALSVLEKV